MRKINLIKAAVAVIVIVFRNSFIGEKILRVISEASFNRRVETRIAGRLPVSVETFQIIARVKIVNPTMKRQRSVTPGAVVALMFRAKNG